MDLGGSEWLVQVSVGKYPTFDKFIDTVFREQ